MRAVRRSSPAGALDLLAAVVADPHCRAVEVLTRAGADAGELYLRIETQVVAREAGRGEG